MPRDFETLTVGDMVATNSGHVFRIAEINGRMARLEFPTGEHACHSSLFGLRLATVQQVAARHVCVSTPSPREAAELFHDGVIPHRVRAALRSAAR